MTEKSSFFPAVWALLFPCPVIVGLLIIFVAAPAEVCAQPGTTLWTKRYDGPAHYDDTPSSIAVDNAGNVIVCGSSCGSNYWNAQ